jgi:hypothetical protein
VVVLNKQSKARMLSKGLVLGAVRVLSKQARQGFGVRLGARCGCKVRVYPSKDKMVWLGAVVGAVRSILQPSAWLGARCGCGAKQTSKVRVWSILQPKAWCLVLVRWRCCAGAVWVLNKQARIRCKV